ncbi:MAG: POTRA domain-containing protein, partial [Planctomycetota bacterium]
MLRNWIVLYGVVIFAGMGLVAVDAAAETVPEGVEIEELEVVGNVTLTRAEVLSVVRTRPGQAFNGKAVNEDIRRIAKLSAVESAYYNTKIENDRVMLTYVVVEHN